MDAVVLYVELLYCLIQQPVVFRELGEEVSSVLFEGLFLCLLDV